MKKQRTRTKLITYIYELAEIYDSNHVPRGAAALSYCLVLSIFPVLICLHAILVRVVPGMELKLEDFQAVVPEDALRVILEYLEYVSTHNNATMVTAGVIGTITTSAAAFRTIQGVMADIQGEARFSGIWNLLFSFVFSLAFLASFYFAGIVIMSGNWVMGHLANAFPALGRIALWQTLKYPLLLVVFVLIIYAIYRITAPRGTKKTVLPGAILAAVLLAVVSYFFSLFINMSTRYALIYSSLASMIICMLWLYACGLILIMCNAVNVVVRRHKNDGVLDLKSINSQAGSLSETEDTRNKAAAPQRKKRIRFKKDTGEEDAR